MPDTMVSEVKHLPPLIELHGTADRNVPPAKGEELVKLGKAVGTEAEYIVYPGGHHGFDFSDTDPMTADALDRIVRFFESRLGGARLIMEVSQPIGTNGLMLPLKQVRPGIRQFDRCDSTLWTAATSAQTPRSGIDARHRRRQSRIKIAALIDIDRAGERITERRLVRVRHLAPDQGCIGDLQRGRERHRLADRVGRAVERVAPGNCPLTTGIRGYLRDGDHHARSRVRRDDRGGGAKDSGHRAVVDAGVLRGDIRDCPRGQRRLELHRHAIARFDASQIQRQHE